MRPILVIIGIVLALLGTVWALQGAYVLPATFMQGPEWIAIGSAVALGGILLAVMGARKPAPSRPA